MYKLHVLVLMLIIICISIKAQSLTGKNDSSLGQYYSIKVGYFNPQKGLNNGLLLGLDGITEFYKYNFFLSGDVDFYRKKTVSIYAAPDITDQSVMIFPLHINLAYKAFELPDAETKFYLGVGGGYYLYFYNATYQTSSSGILFNETTNNNVTKNGGNGFFSVFARVLVGKVFVEPLYYFASAKNESINSYPLSVNPSGFSISIGFQY